MANFTPQQIEQFLQEFFDVVGTRQYIGARYVPIFGRRGESSIEWDDGAPYEPLTIVLHEGSSYTSRTFVPAGVPISDQTYWARTADYDAQVEAYRLEVVRLQEDWVVWKGQTLASLSGMVDAGVASVNLALPPGLAVVFGDSIARGYGLDDPPTERWSARFCAMAGLTEKNFAVDGASFSTTIYAQVAVASADASFDNDDVRYVLVSGGINDHGKTAEQIRNGVAQFASAVNATFTNAVCICLPNLCASKPLDYIDQGDQQYIHSPAAGYVIDAFAQYQPRWIVQENAFQWLIGNPSYAHDNVHPSAAGANLIASKLYSNLRGGSGDHMLSRTTITSSNEHLTVANGVVKMAGGMYEVDFRITVPTEFSAGSDPITDPNIVLLGQKSSFRVFDMVRVAGAAHGQTHRVFLKDGMFHNYGGSFPAGEWYLYFTGIVGL